MYKSTISRFVVNEVGYHHYFNTKTDATHLEDVSVEEPVLLYTVTANCVLHDRAGVIGNFRMDYADSQCWYCEFLSGVIVYADTTDLIKAEEIIFKRLLAGELSGN